VDRSPYMRLCKIWALTMGSRIVRRAAVHLEADADCVVIGGRVGLGWCFDLLLGS
jgi:hypothetical protein